MQIYKEKNPIIQHRIIEYTPSQFENGGRWPWKSGVVNGHSHSEFALLSASQLLEHFGPCTVPFLWHLERYVLQRLQKHLKNVQISSSNFVRVLMGYEERPTRSLRWKWKLASDNVFFAACACRLYHMPIDSTWIKVSIDTVIINEKKWSASIFIMYVKSRSNA